MSTENEIKELLQQLQSDDDKIRSQAALSLGWIGDEKVVTPLILSLQNDTSSKVRANAAMSLGQLNDNRAKQPLIQALKDKDSFVRGMIIYSLGLMKADSAVDALIVVLESDSDKEARMAAADSLAQLENIKAIHPLVKALVNDESKAVRNEAKNSLDRLSIITSFHDLDKLILEEVQHKKESGTETKIEKRQQFLDDMQQKEIDKRRKEIISIIEEELPKMLEYAIHNEEIPFDKICNKFDCDDFTLEFAITKLTDNKKINAKVNPGRRSFIVMKPNAELSEEAQMKLKLIRKKYGIDW